MSKTARFSGLLLAAIALAGAFGLGGPGAPARAETFRPRLLVSDLATLPGNIISIQNIGLTASQIVVERYSSDGELDRDFSQEFDNIQPGTSVLAIVLPGVALISSDEPVSALVIRAAVSGDAESLEDIELSSSVGVGNPINYVGGTQGSTISIPYVANRLDDLYETALFVVNAGDATACVRINYTFVAGIGTTPVAGKAAIADNGSGGPGCPGGGYPVPAHGQMTFSPAGGPDGVAFPAGTAGAQMGATVTSTGSPVHVSVVATKNRTGIIASTQAVYNGFRVSGHADLVPADSTSLSVALAIKSPDGYFSQILLSNPSSSPAQVTITYVHDDGRLFPVVLPLIPPNGAYTHSVYSDNIVPVGFKGSARIESSQPIAAVNFRQKMTTAGSFDYEQLYSAVNALPASSAGKRVDVPFISRRFLNQGGHDGANTWVAVSVPGGGEAHLVLRTAFGENPSGMCVTEGPFEARVTIRGSFTFYQNANQDHGFGAVAPECALGGAMIITSDVPILAVAGFIVDTQFGGTDAMFNVTIRP